MQTNEETVHVTVKPKKTNLATAIADAVEAKNAEHSWDDVEDMRESVGQFILTQAMVVNSLLDTNREKIKELDSLNELAILSNGFSRDIETVVAEFELIKAKHSDKSGRITDSSELFEAMGVFEDYVALNTKINSVLLPTIALITEKLESLFTQPEEGLKNE